MDLKEVGNISSDAIKHWYYFSKSQVVLKLLKNIRPSVILDIGAGSSVFSEYLLANTSACESFCIDINYEMDSRHEVMGKTIHCLRSIENVNADLVLLMDVLEHVEDDTALLQEYIEKVPKGALFLITVPAFNFLWSDHDKFLGHKRRYNLSQLEQLVERAGLDIIMGSYCFAPIFPLVALIRISKNLFGTHAPERSELTEHAPAVHWLMKKICAIELPFVTYNRLGGLTSCCIAQKI
jgi:SAM-dependent methyltransferase